VSFFLFFLAMAMPAYAYIDPNTGGLIAQVLTPLLLVAGAVWAGFRRKIKAWKNNAWSFFQDKYRHVK
jgi:hypothetical protein